jgi:hypothetical protein
MTSPIAVTGVRAAADTVVVGRWAWEECLAERLS